MNVRFWIEETSRMIGGLDDVFGKPLMSHDSPAKPATSTKLVIRNIGLLLSGDLDRPILEADTVVAIDGVIQVVGREKDVDASGVTTTIDAKGTGVGSRAD